MAEYEHEHTHDHEHGHGHADEYAAWEASTQADRSERFARVAAGRSDEDVLRLLSGSGVHVTLHQIAAARRGEPTDFALMAALAWALHAPLSDLVNLVDPVEAGRMLNGVSEVIAFLLRDRARAHEHDDGLRS